MKTEGPLGGIDRPTVGLNIDTPIYQQLEWLRRTRPDTVQSFPTNLREIGRIAEEQGTPLSFDAILTYGEALPPSTRATLHSYFGVEPLDRYASTEIGHIAASCPYSGKLHVSADIVRLEIVDDNDQPVAPGTAGRVIATPFYNYATPFVRYDTGDVGILRRKSLRLRAHSAGAGERPRACAQHLPLSRRHHRPSAPGIRKEVQPFVPHRQFQVVQTALDRIEYRYVPLRPDQPNDLAGLADFVRSSCTPPSRSNSRRCRTRSRVAVRQVRGLHQPRESIRLTSRTDQPGRDGVQQVSRLRIVVRQVRRAMVRRRSS